MAASVLYMSMSLDGFIAGPNETIENGLGDGGTRLHEWVINQSAADEKVLADVNAEVMNEAAAAGASLCGRGTIDPAGGGAGITMTAPRSSSTRAGPSAPAT